MNFVGCIPRFLKAHAGWVLTALGSAGLVGTVILTAKEAPEVEECIQEGEINSIEKWCKETGYDVYTMGVIEEFPDEAYLTTWEKIKIAFPIYLPAILMGTGTLACFWGAQIFNVKKQAALVAAYGSLVMQFDQYREAIKAEYGEEADKKAYAVSQMEVKRLRQEIEKLKEENGPFLYEFASLPGVIIEAKPGDISNGLMHFNRNMQLKGYNDLAELYSFCGVPESCYDKDLAGEYGWQEYENEVGFGVSYVDFVYRHVKNTPSGRPVIIIDTYVPPYEINVDYGFEGNPEERMYLEYSPDRARAFAEAIGKNEIIPAVQANVYAPGLL